MKRLLLSGLMILALLVSCKKTEYTTIVRNITGTQIAICYEEPLLESNVIHTQLYGEPSSEIKMYIDTVMYDGFPLHDVSLTSINLSKGKHYIHFVSEDGYANVPFNYGSNTFIPTEIAGYAPYLIICKEQDMTVGSDAVYQIVNCPSDIQCDVSDNNIIEIVNINYTNSATNTIPLRICTVTTHNKSSGQATINFYNDDFDATEAIYISFLIPYVNISFNETTAAIQQKFGEPDKTLMVSSLLYYQYHNLYNSFSLEICFDNYRVHHYSLKYKYTDDVTNEIITFLKTNYYEYAEKDGFTFYINKATFDDATILIRYNEGSNIITYYSTTNNDYFK